MSVIRGMQIILKTHMLLLLYNVNVFFIFSFFTETSPKKSAPSLPYSLTESGGMDHGYQVLPVPQCHHNLKKKRLKRLSKENEVSSLSKNNFLIFSAYGHSEVGATSVSSRITAALLQKNIFLSPPVWKTKIFSVLHPSLVHILHMLWKNSASLLLFHHWKLLSSSRISDSEPQVIYINENKYI